VAGVRPLTAWLNATGELPDPSAEPPLTGARVPNVSLHVPGLTVEYRNHPVVEAPPGFAAPFRVAEVAATEFAAFVTADGAVAAVANESTLPKEVPTLFAAIAQK
jgi:hypothetical protein